MNVVQNRITDCTCLVNSASHELEDNDSCPPFCFAAGTAQDKAGSAADTAGKKAGQAKDTAGKKAEETKQQL